MAGAEVRAAKLYQWVDESGVTQFTQHPPPGVESREMTVRGLPRPDAPAQEEGSEDGGSPSSPNDRERSPEEARFVPSAPDREAVRAARETNCANARAELQALEASPRLRKRGPDGEVTWVVGDERQARIDAARARVAEYCD